MKYLMIKGRRASTGALNDPSVNGCCATVINVSQTLMCFSNNKVKEVIPDVHYVID